MASMFVEVFLKGNKVIIPNHPHALKKPWEHGKGYA